MPWNRHSPGKWGAYSARSLQDHLVSIAIIQVIVSVLPPCLKPYLAYACDRIADLLCQYTKMRTSEEFTLFVHAYITCARQTYRIKLGCIKIIIIIN